MAKRVRGLKVDLNEDGVGVVAVGIHRGCRTALHRKLDFTSRIQNS